jgi:hypothetical protein
MSSRFSFIKNTHINFTTQENERTAGKQLSLVFVQAHDKGGGIYPLGMSLLCFAFGGAISINRAISRAYLFPTA